MKKALIIIMLGFAGSLHAQQHEFSVHGGGGLSTLHTTTNIGRHSADLSGHFGLGYGYFFHPQWGVATGVEVASYRAKYRLGTFSESYMDMDLDEATFEFRTTASRYEEQRHASMLQVPLMLHFQTVGSNERQFYAAIGGKVGFSLNGKYTGTVTRHNSGYYDYEDYEYTTDRFMGFGEFVDKSSGTLKLGTALFASAELGTKRNLNNRQRFYMGAYLDYGLTSFSGEATPLAAGIKLRFAFGKNAKPQRPLPPPRFY